MILRTTRPSRKGLNVLETNFEIRERKTLGQYLLELIASMTCKHVPWNRLYTISYRFSATIFHLFRTWKCVGVGVPNVLAVE